MNLAISVAIIAAGIIIFELYHFLCLTLYQLTLNPCIPYYDSRYNSKIILSGGIDMMILFVYFLIFLVPGLFAVLMYNRICGHKVECFNAISLAFIFNLLILGINLAVLRYIQGIYTIYDLQCRFNCLSCILKYILLSLFAGIVLAIFACLIQRLYCCCKRHFHCCNRSCN